MIELGTKVRDTITGFTGIITGRTQWLYGCVRCYVEPRELHEGKPVDACTFDEERLEVVIEENKKEQVQIREGAAPGGPRCDPRPILTIR